MWSRAEAVRPIVPKRMCFKRAGLHKFGYTGRGQGCRSVIAVGTQRSHSDACMRRVSSEAGKDGPSVIANAEHFEEFLAKSTGESAKKNAKVEGPAAGGDGAMTDVISGGKSVVDTRRNSTCAGIGGGQDGAMTDVISGRPRRGVASPALWPRKRRGVRREVRWDTLGRLGGTPQQTRAQAG